MAAGPGAAAAGLAAAAAGFFGSIAGPGAIAAGLAAAAAGLGSIAGPGAAAAGLTAASAAGLGSMAAGLAGMGSAAAARQGCLPLSTCELWDGICFARDCTEAHVSFLHIMSTRMHLCDQSLVMCSQMRSNHHGGCRGCQGQMRQVLWMGETYGLEAGGGRSSWLPGRVQLQLAWRQQLRASWAPWLGRVPLRPSWLRRLLRASWAPWQRA